MKMRPAFEQELAWARAQMPRLQRALADLPALTGVRLACSIHLDLKIVPLVEDLLARGAQLFLQPLQQRLGVERVDRGGLGRIAGRGR